MFQSTRPRGARLNTKPAASGNSNVSIHAPTGGATFTARIQDHKSVCFNPRAHGGRDLVRYRAWPVVNVSIHAPTGGATMEVDTVQARELFQSTRPRGARLIGERRFQKEYMFQSTRPRGARQTDTKGLPYRTMFQSTRPRGARRTRDRIAIVSHQVSIHAPTGGATHQPGDRHKMISMFQSTRPRGARLFCSIMSCV